MGLKYLLCEIRDLNMKSDNSVLEAMAWDLISLIRNSPHYNITDYDEDQRFKDFLWKYGISDQNVAVRINELVKKNFSVSGPGRRQLIRKVNLPLTLL